MKLDQLKQKKVLILGFGQEGKDTFKFLKKFFPKKSLAVADQDSSKKQFIRNRKRVDFYSGKNYLKALKNYDIIIKSPGIPLRAITPFITKKQIITSQTEIFFNNCPSKIIGITGTKGKGTTAYLIYKILKDQPQKNQKVRLIGNIGKPVLNFLPSAGKKDIYVYELSSHQLHNLKKSPHIAVFLNIFKEHLDYYRNFKEYVKAKANIALYQKKNDYLIYNEKDKIIKQIAKKSKARKISIKGEYYQLNKAAAKSVAKILKVNLRVIEKTIKNFKNIPHRMELVGRFKKITFYNDSAATMPEATLAAIKVLGDKVETIILGGSDKKLDYKRLAEKVLETKIKNLILFPPTGKRIWKDIVRQNKKKRSLNHFFVSNMKEAMELAYKHTSKGKICLLSPASASFGIFKNYKERGNLFKKYVKLL